MKSLRNFFSKISFRKRQRNSESSIERVEVNFEELNLADLVTIKTFAKGNFGRIDLVHIDNKPTRCFALKKLEKSKLKTATDKRNALSEKQIMSSIKNDFIVEFYKTFSDSTHLYILMECCLGGNLCHRIPIDEIGSRFYAGCIVEALEYLHSQNIVHRDLKLENLVLDNRGYLKVIDFGLAKKLEEYERTFSFCGTLNYCAPEIINSNADGYGVAVDLWALGLLVFEFLFGMHPMDSRERWKVLWLIRRGIDAVEFPRDAPEDAVDFVKELCRSDEQERLGYGFGGFDEIREHCWMKKLNWKALRDRKLTPPIVPVVESIADTSNFFYYIEEEEDRMQDADADQQDTDFDPDWAVDF